MFPKDLFESLQGEYQQASDRMSRLRKRLEKAQKEVTFDSPEKILFEAKSLLEYIEPLTDRTEEEMEQLILSRLSDLAEWMDEIERNM